MQHVAHRHSDEIHQLRAKIERLRVANDKLGFWMSAAIDDPQVCDEMKADVRNWFAAQSEEATPMTNPADIDITNIIRTERAAEREVHEGEKRRLRAWLASSMREGGQLRLLRAMCASAEREVVDLRAALEPFGRNAGAESLSEALGHIGREDLLRARDLSKTD